MAMTPQELLSKAADHIEKYGLLRGKWVPDEVTSDYPNLSSPECPACAAGALALVVSGGKDFSPNFTRRPSERQTMEAAFDLVVERLGLPIPASLSPLDAVIEWSDASDQAEVVAGLRQAAG